MQIAVAEPHLGLRAPPIEQRADARQFLADARPTPEEAVIGRHDGLTRARWLGEAMAELTPRERRIITERRLTEAGATLEDAQAIARRLAWEIWERHRIPVWFYGELAAGRTLADLRRAAAPPPFDVGDRRHPTAGACCVGGSGADPASRAPWE